MESSGDFALQPFPTEPHPPAAGWRRRSAWPLPGVIVLTAMILSTVACGGGSRRGAATDMRPLEQRHVEAIIQEAVDKAGSRPEPGGSVEIVGGTTIDVDVLLSAGRFGIAFITAPEAAKAGQALPAQKGEQLQTVRTTDDARILLLYEENYQFDAGPGHTVTDITAKRKLTKDVTDYVTQVVQAAPAP